MNNIIFRCDASPLIGSGHVMRCLTIANDLRERGFDCIFWSSQETPLTVPFILESGYQVIPSTENPRFLKKATALFIDHYGLDATEESKYRAYAERIIVIDDLANRSHDCDVLIDSTLGRLPENYKNLVPENAILLTGTRYAPLRPAFLKNRAKAITRRQSVAGEIRRILVSLGSTDPHNLTTLVMEALQGLELEVDVIIGSGCPHLQSIKQVAQNMQDSGMDIKLHMNVSNIEALMVNADLAVGAGGTTSWERCALGLPTVLIEVADNQKDNATTLEAHGCIVNLGWHEDATQGLLSETITALVDDSVQMLSMSKRALDICDGRGTQRIAPFVITPESAVSLQLMELEDTDLLYSWQCQPGARRFSRNPDIPHPAEHDIWFQAAIENPDCALYKVIKDDKPVGMLRLDRYKDDLRKFEISILIDKDHHGQGIAANTLAFIRKLEPSADFIAEVLPENKASEGLFLKSGFAKTGETFFEQKGAV